MANQQILAPFFAGNETGAGLSNLSVRSTRQNQIAIKSRRERNTWRKLSYELLSRHLEESLHPLLSRRVGKSQRSHCFLIILLVGYVGQCMEKKRCASHGNGSLEQGFLRVEVVGHRCYCVSAISPVGYPELEISPPPALWPAAVTLSGSPPKSRMCFCTHSSATRWSRRPLLERYPA